MPPTAVHAETFLHHIELQSPNPAALARFYGAAMDMRVETLDGGRLLCVGPQRRMLFADGPQQKMGFAAFACRDRDGLDELRAHAQGADAPMVASPSLLFGSEAFAVRDPDGNIMVFGLAPDNDPQPKGITGPLQHVTLGTSDVTAIEKFYTEKLGFLLSDRVFNEQGDLTTCFMRSNHEHHTLGCFRSAKVGIDHHSYEAGEWDRIRDWCDHFATQDIQLMWGPGRHGPGNNLFIFIADPDGNWIEVSAEIEIMRDRKVKHWPHGERTLNLWGRAILRS
jgi:catechol 2,3-dioxygenase